MKKFSYGKAICYSGFREGQNPHKEVYPTYEETLEDLKILEKEYKYIRMYAPNKHAEIALQVIKENKLNLLVMLGVDLLGEHNNPDCSWGGDYTVEETKKHVQLNNTHLDDLVKLANEYKDIIFSVSAGNEAVPEWNENLVMPEKVLEYVKYLKKNVTQPVTYCDGGYYWLTNLVEVAKEVDFISVHTYPAWVGSDIDGAIDIAKDDFNKTIERYPNKVCIITETGWPSNSDGKTIKKEVATLEKQTRFIKEINEWSEDTETLMFLFEAFDEPWKGGGSPSEPEKNWGLYYVDRIIKNKE
jgi:exo-beta-1,3-glucanase (GH17 family)